MKAKARANNITSKKCAFCKNWYDPANSAIKLWDNYMGI